MPNYLTVLLVRATLFSYWYHADHLGSAQLISDWQGEEYERIEYTPYGELWVEKVKNGYESINYRFTGKEMDSETGLYYFGARYLDPKYSRWLSTDPALGDYIPQAPVNDEAKKANNSLPGQGGLFNQVNFHLYHYAGNNPVRYIDPDGEFLEVSDNGDGTYTITGGSVNSDKNIYIMNNGKRGAVLGQMLTENSFFDEGTLVIGAIIDTSDASGSEFLENFENNTPDIFSYINNARNGKIYDFKDFGKGNLKGNELNKYRHRGMQLGIDENGNKIFGSARDVGNYAAGYVAGKSGLYWIEARLGFDAYQSFKSRRFCSEGAATQAAQRLGFTAGQNSSQGKAVTNYRLMRMQMMQYR